MWSKLNDFTQKVQTQLDGFIEEGAGGMRGGEGGEMQQQHMSHSESVDSFQFAGTSEPSSPGMNANNKALLNEKEALIGKLQNTLQVRENEIANLKAQQQLQNVKGGDGVTEGALMMDEGENVEQKIIANLQQQVEKLLHESELKDEQIQQINLKAETKFKKLKAQAVQKVHAAKEENAVLQKEMEDLRSQKSVGGAEAGGSGELELEMKNLRTRAEELEIMKENMQQQLMHTAQENELMNKRIMELIEENRTMSDSMEASREQQGGKAELEALVNAKQEELDKIAGDKVNMENDFRGLLATVDQLKMERQSLSSKVESLEIVIEKMKEDGGEQVGASVSATPDADLQAQYEQLVNEVETLRSQKQSRESDYSSMLAENNALKTEMNESSNALNILNNRIAEIEVDSNVVRAENDSLKSQLAEASNLLNSRIAEMEGNGDAIEELKRLVNEKERAIGEIQAAHSALLTENDSLKGEISQIRESGGNVSVSSSVRHSGTNTPNEEHGPAGSLESDKKLVELKLKYSKLLKLYKETKTQLTDLKQGSTNPDGASNGPVDDGVLRKELEAAKHAENEMLRTVNALKEELGRAKAEHEAAMGQMNDIRASAEMSKEIEHDLLSKIGKLEKELATSKSEKEVLLDADPDMEEKLELAQQNEQNLKEVVANLEDSVAKVKLERDEALKALNDNSQSAGGEVEQLRKELAESQENATFLTEEIESLSSEKDELLKNQARAQADLQKNMGEVENLRTCLFRNEELLRDAEQTRDEYKASLNEAEAKIDADVHSFNEQKAALEMQCQSLREKVEQQQESLNQSALDQSQASQHSEKLVEAENKLEVKNSEIEILKQEISTLKSQGSASESELKEKVAHCNRLEKLNEELEERMEEIDQDGQATVSELEATNAALTDKVSELGGELNEMQSRLNEAEMERETQRALVSELKGNMKESESMQTENADLRSQIQELSSSKVQVETLNAQLTAGLSEKEGLEKTISELKNLLDGSNTEKKALEEQLGVLSRRLEANEALQEEKANLESQLASLNGSFSQLETEKKSVESRVEDLQKAMESSAEHQEGVEAKMHSLTSENQELSIRIQAFKSVEDKCRSQQEIISQLKYKIKTQEIVEEELRSQVAEQEFAKTEVEVKEKERITLEKKIKDLETTNEELVNAKEQAEMDVEEFKNTHADMNATIQELRSEVLALKDASNTSVADVSAKDDVIVKLEGSLREYQTELENLRAEKVRLGVVEKEYSDKLVENNRQLEKLYQDMEQKNNELRHLQQHSTDLSNRLKEVSESGAAQLNTTAEEILKEQQLIDIQKMKEELASQEKRRIEAEHALAELEKRQYYDEKSSKGSSSRKSNSNLAGSSGSAFSDTEMFNQSVFGISLAEQGDLESGGLESSSGSSESQNLLQAYVNEKNGKKALRWLNKHSIMVGQYLRMNAGYRLGGLVYFAFIHVLLLILIF
eukprot:Nk52_evm27s307 gene=Nk52_evmTU27s307